MSLSPDFVPYRDLSLTEEKDADVLVDDALAAAVAKLPGWVPRTGNLEVVLLEAQGLIVSELLFAVNRVPGVVVEGLASLLGVTRSAGSAAVGTARFRVADALGHVIPAGLRLSAPLGEGTIMLTTATALTIPEGQATGTVTVRATETGADANGLLAGAPVTAVDAVPFLDRVELLTDLAGGADVEDDASYASRAVTRARRLTSTLVVDEHFRLAALEYPGVTRAQVLPLYDPRTSSLPGADLGHVTVAASQAGGLPLEESLAAALARSLDDRAVAGLTVHVVAPTVTVLDLRLTVRRFAGATDDGVRSAIRAVLAAYLSPDSWDYAPTVPVNELIARVDAAPGVDLVLAVDPPADVPLPGVAPLVRLGAVDVTVVAP